MTSSGVRRATGIGGGMGNTPGAPGTFAMNGNGVVYTRSISDTSPIQNGILFVGGTEFPHDSGTVYGDVILENDLAVGSLQTLTIPPGASLTVPDGVTLINNGTIIGYVSGTVTGNPPIGFGPIPPTGTPNIFPALLAMLSLTVASAMLWGVFFARQKKEEVSI